MTQASRLKAEAQAKAKAEADALAKRAMEIDTYKQHLENTARTARTEMSVSVAEYQLAQVCEGLGVRAVA